MKKTLSLTFLICAIFILVSCEDKDEVADEIVHYYNEEWISINDMKGEEMRDIRDNVYELEKEDKTDEAANLVRNEVLPLNDKVLKQLESIDPANKRIKKMNDMQIESEEQAEKMLKDVIIFYENGEETEEDLKKSKDKLEDKYDDVLDYRDKSIDKYELEKVEHEDEDSKYDKLKRADD